MSSQILLSICIPTYNRAEYLASTLTAFVSQDRFQNSDEIEIIISDNCSTDNTQNVVQNFIEQYGDKVKYFRNDKNVIDENMELALSRGRGEFLKLSNDTLMPKDGALGQMCDFIRENVNKKPNLFFLNSWNFKGVSSFESPNKFIEHISIYSTWIACFGIWRDDFDALKDFSRFAKQRLPQTDVLFRMLEKKKRTLVFNNLIFDVQQVAGKGGYNTAEVFGRNYIMLLKRAKDNGIISGRVFRNQKRKMLKHINSLYFDFKKEYAFQHGDYWKYMSDYHSEPYFYLSFINVAKRYILSKIF